MNPCTGSIEREMKLGIVDSKKIACKCDILRIYALLAQDMQGLPVALRCKSIHSACQISANNSSPLSPTFIDHVKHTKFVVLVSKQEQID